MYFYISFSSWYKNIIIHDQIDSILDFSKYFELKTNVHLQGKWLWLIISKETEASRLVGRV